MLQFRVITEESPIAGKSFYLKSEHSLCFEKQSGGSSCYAETDSSSVEDQTQLVTYLHFTLSFSGRSKALTGFSGYSPQSAWRPFEYSGVTIEDSGTLSFVGGPAKENMSEIVDYRECISYDRYRNVFNVRLHNNVSTKYYEILENVVAGLQNGHLVELFVFDAKFLD